MRIFSEAVGGFRLPRHLQVVTRALVLAIVLVATGCGASARQIQAQVGHTIGESANQALPILVNRYEKMGDDILAELKARGATKSEARSAIEGHKANWEPIWKAWDSLQIAQNGFADALESGGSIMDYLSELRQAFCELRAVWPKEIPAIPLAPVVCR